MAGKEPAAAASLLSRLAALAEDDENGARTFARDLTTFLGPTLTEQQQQQHHSATLTTARRKSLEALARQHSRFLPRLLKECQTHLAGAGGPSARARCLADACSAGLVALERLQPVLDAAAPIDLDRHWSRLVARAAEHGLHAEALAAAAQLRARMLLQRRQRSVLAPIAERETADSARVAVSLCFHEVQALLATEGLCSRVLALIDRELLPWIDAMDRLEPQAAAQYAAVASHTAQKASVRALARPEGVACAALGVRLLAMATKRAPVSQFFIEAARCPLIAGTAGDALATGRAYATLVDEARKTGALLPPPPATTGRCPEFVEWCHRCVVGLKSSQQPQHSQLALDVLAACIEFLRDVDDPADADQLGLSHLTLALMCVQDEAGGAALLATAEVNLGCAVDVLRQCAKKLSYSMLYRTTKTLDDLKRAAVQGWEPLAPQKGSSSAVSVPHPLLCTFGRAMLLFFDQVSRGYALDRDPSCKDAAAKQRFRPIQHYRVDALQCAMQAFQTAEADSEIAELLQRASEYTADATGKEDSAESRVVLRRLAGMYYNFGVGLYNTKQHAQAIDPLRHCCELLEASSPEEAKQAGISKKYELLAICHQRVSADARAALDALAKSATWAVRLGTEISPSVIQRFVQICAKSFESEPEHVLLLSRPIAEIDTAAFAKLSEQHLSAMQSRCAPVVHQLALLDFLDTKFEDLGDVVHRAAAIIEKAKTLRMLSSNEDRLQKSAALLQEAIDLLKDNNPGDDEPAALDELATAYAWLGITEFESKRESSATESPASPPRQTSEEDLSKLVADTSDALRSLHYALGIWSKLDPSALSSSSLQVLQCSIDLLSICGDFASQVNASILAEKISEKAEAGDEAAFCATTISRLAIVRAYDALGLHEQAAAYIKKAEAGLQEFLANDIPEDEDLVEDESGAAAPQKRLEHIRALFIGAKLSHSIADDTVVLDDEDKLLQEAFTVLGGLSSSAERDEPKTWEEYAVEAELEYAVGEALLRRGQSGRALENATSALRHRFSVISVLMPAIAEGSASDKAKAVQQVYSRSLFSEWRLLEGLADSFLQAGWMHELRQSVHEAHYFYSRGVSLGAVLHVPKIAWTFLQELGELEYRRRDISASEAHFQKAQLLMGRADTAASQPQSLLPRKEQVLAVVRLGDLQRRAGNMEKARAHYTEALELCSSGNAPSKQDSAIEVLARRGDQTPREARILGLASRTSGTRRLQLKARPLRGKKSASPEQQQQQQPRKIEAPFESLAARIEGKLARVAVANGNVKEAEKLLSGALGRDASPIVRGVLHLRFAQLTLRMLAAAPTAVSGQLMKTVESHAAKAFDTAATSGIPSFLRDACMTLALAQCQEDPFRVGDVGNLPFLVNASLGIPVCQQAMLIDGQRSREKEKRQKQPADELDMIGEKLEELTIEDNDGGGGGGGGSLFDLAQTPSREKFQRQYVDCLPANWTVVSLAATEDPQSLLVCRMQPQRPSVVLRHNAQSLSAAFSELSVVLAENKVTANASASTEEERVAWWAGRAALDSRFRMLLAKTEDTCLGWAKSLLLGPFADDAVRVALEARATEFCKKHWKKPSDDAVFLAEMFMSAVPFLDEDQLAECAFRLLDEESKSAAAELEAFFRKSMEDARLALHKAGRGAPDRDLCAWGKDLERHPVVLVLDKTLQSMPWESMPCLAGFAVSRVPSLAFVTALACGASSKRNVVLEGLDPEQAFFVIDPASNLPKTAAAMRPVLAAHPQWRGTVSQAPTSPAELLASLEASDLLLYSGHGSGEQYLPGHELTALRKCPAVLLMGCSSAVLRPQGEFEPTGAPVHWLTAGSPAVVGNLWDVTDGDLDLLTQALLAHWAPPISEQQQAASAAAAASVTQSLSGALAVARRACKLKSLVGAAAVCYGVPLLCKQQRRATASKPRRTRSAEPDPEPTAPTRPSRRAAATSGKRRK